MCVSNFSLVFCLSLLSCRDTDSEIFKSRGPEPYEILVLWSEQRNVEVNHFTLIYIFVVLVHYLVDSMLCMYACIYVYNIYYNVNVL